MTKRALHLQWPSVLRLPTKKNIIYDTLNTITKKIHLSLKWADRIAYTSEGQRPTFGCRKKQFPSMTIELYTRYALPNFCMPWFLTQC